MTKTTTPSEAHDATQVKPVRIPERFPEYSPSATNNTTQLSPELEYAAVDNSDGQQTYDAPKNHFLHFGAAVDNNTRVNLTADNFNPSNGLCVLQAYSNSGAALLASLSGQSPIFIGLPQYKDTITTLALSKDEYGSIRLILLSQLSTDPAS